MHAIGYERDVIARLDDDPLPLILRCGETRIATNAAFERFRRGWDFMPAAREFPEWTVHEERIAGRGRLDIMAIHCRQCGLRRHSLLYNYEPVLPGVDLIEGQAVILACGEVALPNEVRQTTCALCRGVACQTAPKQHHPAWRQ